MKSLLELLEAEDKLVKNIRFAKASYEDFKDISYNIANDYKEIAEKSKSGSFDMQNGNCKIS